MFPSSLSWRLKLLHSLFSYYIPKTTLISAKFSGIFRQTRLDTCAENSSTVCLSIAGLSKHFTLAFF